MCHIIHTSNLETILGKAATAFTEKLTRKHIKASFFQFIDNCLKSKNHYETIIVLNCCLRAVMLHESFLSLTGRGTGKLL